MLTGKQRSFLRAKGNNLDPIIHLGKDGIDDNFLEQISQALEAREIVKIRVLKNSSYDSWEACNNICSQLNAEPVQVIGSNFVIYRKSKEKPRIELP